VNRIDEQFAEIAEQHLECLTILVEKVLLRDHRPGFEASIKPLRKRIEDEGSVQARALLPEETAILSWGS
jgi:hypothetical protein